MKENKHGFEPKQEFTMGGIAWTVIQTGADWVKCIASDCVEERAFDEGNKNDFAASSLRAYLNGEFLRRLIKAGAPEEMFEYFNIDLTADDGLKNYGGDRVRIGLITCEEYRLLRGNIPALPDRWWWTATPDSPINSFVRSVNSIGSLNNYNAYNGGYFGEDINGNPREGGTATWEEITEELSDAGILKEIKTARRWRNKIVNDMAVCVFGIPAAVSAATYRKAVDK